MNRQKTKIIATIGPSSETKEVISHMIQNGLSVVRANMSHGTHDEHKRRIALVRRLAKAAHKQIQVLVDLSGPKMRVLEMNDEVFLKKGTKVIVTTKKIVGTNACFAVSYKSLAKEVVAGQTILINDGKIELSVLKTNSKDELLCLVKRGGLLTSRKGFNIPGAHLKIPTLSQKDKDDILFAHTLKAEYIAVSFVRHAKDLEHLKKYRRENKYSFKVVSKIETLEALDELDSIIKESDVVMVARGDLAIEIGYAHVPIIQKKIISLCKKYNKEVIVATEVLSSMEKSPHPTRAEVSDIAGAVFDKVDYLMLSNETAVGEFPVETVQMMSSVCKEIELACKKNNFFN